MPFQPFTLQKLDYMTQYQNTMHASILHTKIGTHYLIDSSKPNIANQALIPSVNGYLSCYWFLTWMSIHFEMTGLKKTTTKKKLLVYGVAIRRDVQRIRYSIAQCNTNDTDARGFTCLWNIPSHRSPQESELQPCCIVATSFLPDRFLHCVYLPLLLLWRIQTSQLDILYVFALSGLIKIACCLLPPVMSLGLKYAEMSANKLHPIL